MAQLDRRSFLRLSGLAAGGFVVPGCINDALDIPANEDTHTIMDVEHVVILLQENRSFDHYLGTQRGVRGFGDRFTIPVADAPTVFHQRTETDVVLPFHLDEVAGNAQRVTGTPHGFDDGHAAWDHGRYGRWPTFKQPQSMGYYTQRELPFQFALTEAFTVCDAYFSGIHGSTNPNRLFAFTGTNDPLGRGGGPAIDNTNDSLGPPNQGYTWKTYAERLEEAGVSWMVYQDVLDNFSDNPLAGFQAFRQAYFTDSMSPLAIKGVGSPLTNQTLDGLRNDVLGRRLPSVSWIVGPALYSEHPGPSSPVQGAFYVQQVLEALTADPEVWSKTVLLVTYDENDGFFDHVPTPCAPSRRDDGVLMGKTTVDDTGERYDDTLALPFGGAPHGPGVRVPMWIISPWTRGGWVCSETFDHTSILRFLEKRFGVAETNISPFRRAVCGDLTSAFDFVTPNDPAVPTLPGRTRSEADGLRAAQEALPAVPVPVGASGQLPVQDTGTRPSRALPYELDVHGAVDDAARAVTLGFDNTGTAAAVFHVYDRQALEEIPRRYAVEAGKTLSDVWTAAPSTGRYELFVLGPNGFHREYRGVAGAGLEIETAYDADGQRLSILCRNTGTAARRFLIAPRAYSTAAPTAVDVAAGAEVERWFDVAASGRWYDLAIAVEGDAEFLRRVAGRIENGAPSVSDPAMGLG